MGIKWCALLCGITVLVGSMSGQRLDQLESQRERLLREIDQVEAFLYKTSTNIDQMHAQLQALDLQIKQRRQLLTVLDRERRALQKHIQILTDSIAHIEHNLAKVNRQYRFFLRKAYIHRMTRHPYALLTASEKQQHDAYARLFLTRSHSKLRNTRHELMLWKRQLSLQRDSVHALLTKTDSLVQLTEAHKDLLERDLQRRQHLLQQLQERREELDRQLKQHRRRVRQINDLIVRTITEQLNDQTSAEDHRLRIGETPAFVEGQMPWPVEGVIISRFGRQPHPSLKGIYTTNNGIDIRTGPGAVVRSVSDGTVTRVVAMPNYGYIVLVRSGTYHAVYGKLAEHYVEEGSSITRGQPVGRLHADGKHSGILHFEWWKGKTKLNPERWLAPQ